MGSVITIAILVSSAVWAALGRDAMVELQMKYALNQQGQKVFGCHWFESKQIGVCHFALEWRNRSTDETGYSLELSKSRDLVLPRISNQCAISKFGGHISAREGEVQQISFQLRGSACGRVIDQFKTSPIKFQFHEVPSEMGEHHARVQLEIDDTPVR
ncbi:MAG: hypothetical protein HYR96_10815 [Deltaproteobacteria bacterium]|nr:hypothetical protein [Deltaproteobacteria bacterium]MBI3293620.1 hypothetical protein [Deltaproteobacteria bacterium]